MLRLFTTLWFCKWMIFLIDFVLLILSLWLYEIPVTVKVSTNGIYQGYDDLVSASQDLASMVDEESLSIQPSEDMALYY